MGISTNPAPVIITDTREQTPLVFRRFPTIRAGLLTGDYSIAGLESQFAIERKSIPDIVSCCMGSNRERFENELHRLRGFRFKRLLVIGTRAEIEGGAYRSTIKPASVLGTIGMIEARYDCPVVFEATPEDGAARVEGWAWYFAREILKAAEAMTKAVIPEALPA